MTIKTWQEREFAAKGVLSREASVNLALAESEIGELRAALQERDAEIDRMKDINRSLVDKANRQNLHDARQSEVLTAQRKVLEHVLDTLTIVYGLGTETPIIKEIQEILKCN